MFLRGTGIAWAEENGERRKCNGDSSGIKGYDIGDIDDINLASDIMDRRYSRVV